MFLFICFLWYLNDSLSLLRNIIKLGYILVDLN